MSARYNNYEYKGSNRMHVPNTLINHRQSAPQLFAAYFN